MPLLELWHVNYGQTQTNEAGDFICSTKGSSPTHIHTSVFSEENSVVRRWEAWGNHEWTSLRGLFLMNCLLRCLSDNFILVKVLIIEHLFIYKNLFYSTTVRQNIQTSCWAVITATLSKEVEKKKIILWWIISHLSSVLIKYVIQHHQITLVSVIRACYTNLLLLCSLMLHLYSVSNSTHKHIDSSETQNRKNWRD